MSSSGVIVLLTSVAASHNVVDVLSAVSVEIVVFVLVCVDGFWVGRSAGWNGWAFADMD